MVAVLAVADEEVASLGAGRLVRGQVDLIVAAGDLAADYLEHLTNVFDVPCVLVPGNHDPDLSGYTSKAVGMVRAGLPARWPGPDGAINADGRVVDVAGLRIVGLGGSLRYRPGPNQWTQRQQARRAAGVSLRARWRCRDGRGVDVVLTHAPPRGTGDAEDAPHRGFDCLHPLVARLTPTLLLHGHVHPHGHQPRDHQMGSTAVLNTVGFALLDITTGAVRVAERRHGA
ncbi:MAG: metallophosphoesterase [Mycobacteriaceae bacterium]